MIPHSKRIRCPVLKGSMLCMSPIMRLIILLVLYNPLHVCLLVLSCDIPCITSHYDLLFNYCVCLSHHACKYLINTSRMCVCLVICIYYCVLWDACVSSTHTPYSGILVMSNKIYYICRDTDEHLSHVICHMISTHSRCKGIMLLLKVVFNTFKSIYDCIVIPHTMKHIFVKDLKCLTCKSHICKLYWFIFLCD